MRFLRQITILILFSIGDVSLSVASHSDNIIKSSSALTLTVPQTMPLYSNTRFSTVKKSTPRLAKGDQLFVRQKVKRTFVDKMGRRGFHYYYKVMVKDAKGKSRYGIVDGRYWAPASYVTQSASSARTQTARTQSHQSIVKVAKLPRVTSVIRNSAPLSNRGELTRVSHRTRSGSNLPNRKIIENPELPNWRSSKIILETIGKKFFDVNAKGQFYLKKGRCLPRLDRNTPKPKKWTYESFTNYFLPWALELQEATGFPAGLMFFSQRLESSWGTGKGVGKEPDDLRKIYNGYNGMSCWNQGEVRYHRIQLAHRTLESKAVCLPPRKKHEGGYYFAYDSPISSMIGAFELKATNKKAIGRKVLEVLKKYPGEVAPLAEVVPALHSYGGWDKKTQKEYLDLMYRGGKNHAWMNLVPLCPVENIDLTPQPIGVGVSI